MSRKNDKSKSADATPVVVASVPALDATKVNEKIELARKFIAHRERCYVVLETLKILHAKVDTILRETYNSNTECGEIYRAKVADKMELEKQVKGYEVNGVTIPAAPEGAMVHSFLKDVKEEIRQMENTLTMGMQKQIRELEDEATRIEARKLVSDENDKKIQALSRAATAAANAKNQPANVRH